MKIKTTKLSDKYKKILKNNTYYYNIGIMGLFEDMGIDSKEIAICIVFKDGKKLFFAYNNFYGGTCN